VAMKFLDLVNRIIRPFKKAPDMSKFNNVLVVSNSGLGDTLLSTPAILSLRKSHPKIRITFLVNAKMYPLFKEIDFVDDFLLYSRGVLAQLKLIRVLRNKKVDTIFLLHSNGPEDVFFSILSGARTILKMTYSTNHEFSSIFSNPPAIHSKHNIENKLNMVRMFDSRVIETRMQVAKNLRDQCGYIEKHKDCTYVGLQIGAQDLYKMWPIEKFINFVNTASNKYPKLRFVLFGSTKLEVELSRELLDSVNKPHRVLNICGQTAIDELPLAVNDMDCIVTGDTGILHLAIALEKHTISLFGPTDHKEYGPYQDAELHSVIQVEGSFLNHLPKRQRGQAGMCLIETDSVLDELEKRMGFK